MYQKKLKLTKLVLSSVLVLIPLTSLALGDYAHEDFEDVGTNLQNSNTGTNWTTNWGNTDPGCAGFSSSATVLSGTGSKSIFYASPQDNCERSFAAQGTSGTTFDYWGQVSQTNKWEGIMLGVGGGVTSEGTYGTFNSDGNFVIYNNLTPTALFAYVINIPYHITVTTYPSTNNFDITVASSSSSVTYTNSGSHYGFITDDGGGLTGVRLRGSDGLADMYIDDINITAAAPSGSPKAPDATWWE